MKKPLYIICLSAILLSGSASASQAYKCVADDGSVTFSFVSCPERVITASVRSMTIHERMAKIRDLDSAINSERERFRQNKATLNVKISTTDNRIQVQSLRNQVEMETVEFMERLSELREDRRNLVNDDVRLLQSADQSS